MVEVLTAAWLGDCDDTTACVMVRSNVPGTISVAGQSATVDPTVTGAESDDGVARFDVPHGTHAISINGVQYDTITTKRPPTGQEFELGWGSCQNTKRDTVMGHVLAARNLACFAWIGDYIYTLEGHGKTIFGRQKQAIYSMASPTHQDVYRHYQQAHLVPGNRALHRSCPTYWIGDDHEEISADNWDNTLTQLNSNGASLGSTQADVTYYGDMGERCMEIYFGGNPLSGGAFRHMYWHKRIQHVELFCLNEVHYRTALATADSDTSKKFITDTMMAQLKADMAASTATFKVFLSPKKFWKNVGDNDDILYRYQVQRDELADWMAANLTGAVILAGDKHCPDISYDSTRELLQVNACAMTQYNQIYGHGIGYAEHNQWKPFGYDGKPPAALQSNLGGELHCAGVLRVTPEYIEPLIVYESGYEVSAGRIYAGSNERILRPVAVG